MRPLKAFDPALEKARTSLQSAESSSEAEALSFLIRVLKTRSVILASVAEFAQGLEDGKKPVSLTTATLRSKLNSGEHDANLLPASLDAIVEASTVASDASALSEAKSVEEVKELKRNLQEKVARLASCQLHAAAA